MIETIDVAAPAPEVSNRDASEGGSGPVSEWDSADVRRPAEFDRADLPEIAVVAVPDCPVCGRTGGTPYTVGHDYEYRTCSNAWRLVRCDRCEHVWLNPRPASSELARIYPPEYYAYQYESTVNPIAVRAKQWLDRAKMRSVLRFGAEPPRSFLDIGCGSGRFLRLMHDWGLAKRDIHGLELDRSVVAALNGEGYRVFNERVESCHDIEPNSLDLVTMFHVIEHVDDPGAVVQRVHDWLRPGGVFAIETPNLDSQDARWFRDSFWGGYHIPRHWNLFTAQTLRRLCEDRGLQVRRVTHQPGHSFWMYSLHHRLRYGQPPRPKWAELFDPFKSLLPLAGFTAYDKLRASLGFKTSAILMVLTKG